MTRRPVRRGRAALAVALLAPSLAAAVPAAAEPADGIVQTTQCVEDLRTLDPVSDGVSAAQRSLGWTRVWDLSRGDGVTVAVLDTGVNRQPAFEDRLTGIGDVVGESEGTPGLADCDGHGTVVAGIIAGAPDTTSGWAGVAPDVRVLSYRATTDAYARVGEDGERTAVGTPGSLAEAVDAAVREGADVVNVSAGYCGPYLSTTSPTLEAAVRRATAAGAVVVAAAANLGEGACSTQNTSASSPTTGVLPAMLDGVLAVGSLTDQGLPSDFSLAGPWVGVAAPGEGLVSVNPHPRGEGEVDAFVTSDGTIPISGTSFSTAYVSGVVALVRARFPRLTPEQVVSRVQQTANHPGGAGGRTLQVGYGEVDLRRALTAVIPAEGAAGLPVEPSSADAAQDADGPSSEATRPTALPAPPVVADTTLSRTVALAGSGLLVLLLVGTVVGRAIRRRGHGS